MKLFELVVVYECLLIIEQRGGWFFPSESPFVFPTLHSWRTLTGGQLRLSIVTTTWNCATNADYGRTIIMCRPCLSHVYSQRVNNESTL